MSDDDTELVRVRRRRRSSGSSRSGSSRSRGSRTAGRRPGGAAAAWFWAPILGGLVLLVGIAAGLLLRDALAVRDSLQAAQDRLGEVRTAAGDVEIDAAAEALAAADAELAEARSRSRGPLWSLGARMPVVGDSVELTRATVDLASAAVAVADVAVTDGEELVAAGLDVQVDDGVLDLGPLLQARELLDDLPADRLADARDRVAAIEPAWAPDELLEGRRTSLALADDALATIDHGRTLLDALPGFLGTDEPRRYFLGVQTPAELRGTGGMIGYWAVLRVDGGSFELTRSDVYDAIEDVDEPTTARIGDLRGDITRGAVADEEFRERYEHVAATGLFSNVNVDPDLPTTARVALDLFELRTGETLDGMILLDPIAMQLILEAIGADIEVPAAAVDEGAPEVVPADGFAHFALVDVYEEFGQGRGPERKQLLRGLGDAAFARVFDGRWDGTAVVRAIGDAAGARHLQVMSADEDEQAAFVDLGVAGRLATEPGADLLAVTANNAVGGKQDVHVGHHVRAELALSDPRRADDGDVSVARAADVRVELYNPLPPDGMDTYILGSCLPRAAEGSGCFDGPPGQNRTWFSVWTPDTTTLRSASGDDGAAAIRTGQLRDLSVVDRFVTTPSRQRSGFDLAYNGRAPAHLGEGTLVYELLWWGQAKGVPTRLELDVAAPDGWEVADVEVVGPGPDAPVLFGETEDLAVEAGDGPARITGTLAGDARLRVVMAPAG